MSKRETADAEHFRFRDVKHNIQPASKWTICLWLFSWFLFLKAVADFALDFAVVRELFSDPVSDVIYHLLF